MGFLLVVGIASTVLVIFMVLLCWIDGVVDAVECEQTCERTLIGQTYAECIAECRGWD
jgi:hypothetical protein